MIACSIAKSNYARVMSQITTWYQTVKFDHVGHDSQIYLGHLV